LVEAPASSPPLLSFIVLSYNYENFIEQTLRSILRQTVQDFEIVVVDDSSVDRSCEIILGINDPRIRLIVNDRNLGGAASYNVAVRAARGEWLVNLDADDWIAPEKTARQLKAVKSDPSLDIVGTWVNVVGADGKRHPFAETIEQHINADYPLNLIDTWIGRNHLCRSSTMVRRAAHLKVGLDDEGMVSAPDYELWTRALGQGCRFGMVPEKLTFMRSHPRGVTRADLTRSVLEICFALRKNVRPIIEKRGLWPSFAQVLRWIGTNPEVSNLPARERERLMALMFTDDLFGTFADFRMALSSPAPTLEVLGRRALFTFAQLEFGANQDIWSLSKALENARKELEIARQPPDAVFENTTESIQSQPRELGAAQWTTGQASLTTRLKRLIAPRKGRWVRTKARLIRIEQRLSRFFHS